MHALQPAIDYVNRRIIEWQAIVMNLVAMRDGHPLAEIPSSLPDRSPAPGGAATMDEIAPTPPRTKGKKGKVKRTYIKRGTARGDARPTVPDVGETPALPGDGAPKVKRKYTRRVKEVMDVRRTGKAVSQPAPQSVAQRLEKPDTIGGAMKFVAKQLKTFTRAQLVEALEADKDFAKIMADASPAAMGFNLKYWSTHGKIEKSGDGDDATYTVIDGEF